MFAHLQRTSWTSWNKGWRKLRGCWTPSSRSWTRSPTGKHGQLLSAYTRCGLQGDERHALSAWLQCKQWRHWKGRSSNVHCCISSVNNAHVSSSNRTKDSAQAAASAHVLVDEMFSRWQMCFPMLCFSALFGKLSLDLSSSLVHLNFPLCCSFFIASEQRDSSPTNQNIFWCSYIETVYPHMLLWYKCLSYVDTSCQKDKLFESLLSFSSS